MMQGDGLEVLQLGSMRGCEGDGDAEEERDEVGWLIILSGVNHKIMRIKWLDSCGGTARCWR